MILSLVAAASENKVIGRGGTLPWSLPNDMRHFKEVTMGKPVIMGRKTYDSIGHPLPGRRNIIITRQPGLTIEGCDVVTSLDEAVHLAEKENAAEICVIGGGEIYRLSLPIADRIYLTVVHETVDGDAKFPEFSTQEWKEVEREDYPQDDEHEYAYSFVIYERQK